MVTVHNVSRETFKVQLLAYQVSNIAHTTNKTHTRKGEKTMREKMVTRSMKVTNAQVLMVNLETQATETQTVAMPNVYKDDVQLMKALTKTFEGSTLKPVHVLSSEVIEKLYGMSEKTFLDNAHELDPETRKRFVALEAPAEG